MLDSLAASWLSFNGAECNAELTFFQLLLRSQDSEVKVSLTSTLAEVTGTSKTLFDVVVFYWRLGLCWEGILLAAINKTSYDSAEHQRRIRCAFSILNQQTASIGANNGQYQCLFLVQLSFDRKKVGTVPCSQFMRHTHETPPRLQQMHVPIPWLCGVAAVSVQCSCRSVSLRTRRVKLPEPPDDLTILEPRSVIWHICTIATVCHCYRVSESGVSGRVCF